MKHRLLHWLACPTCRSERLRLEARRTRTVRVTSDQFSPEEGVPDGVDRERGTETEVMDGLLCCDECGAKWPIQDGVPRMMPADAAVGPASAHRWTTFDAASPAWEENFLDLMHPLLPADFLGKTVLDAGCGYGRHAFFAARYGAEVIALDSSTDAISSAAANTKGCSRVHLVQGDVYRPPVRDGAMDHTWAFGLLHHLEQPERAFEALGQTVRSGGRLSLWTYGPRQGLTLHISNALRGASSGMTADQQHSLSKNIARALRLFSHTPYRFLAGVPVAGTVVSHLPVHDHHQWPFDVVVADIYDRLRIPVRHWFTRERLEGMLTNAGYADVQVSRRVRNNETFRASSVRR
jgi:SAM-dependent methyltransferase